MVDSEVAWSSTSSKMEYEATRSPTHSSISTTESHWSSLTSSLGTSPCANHWRDARHSHEFQVRGATYSYDRNKIPAGEGVCPLLWFDIFRVPESFGSRVDNIGSKGACADRIRSLTTGHNVPYIFLTAIQVPGTPLLYLVMYWAVDPNLLKDDESKVLNPETSAFSNLLRQYTTIPPITSLGCTSPVNTEGCSGDVSESYHFHNNRFKLIPRIVEGPWLVKKVVGSVPCLLGMKVTTRYYKGDGYVETNVEVGSSAVAQHVIGCCRGASSAINVQLGVVLQGENVLELPERLLGAIQFKWLYVDDLNNQTPLFK